MQFITGATLIDGTGADPIANASIVIGDDGRITEVGAGLSRPSGATVLDVGGATVMPGLVDAHVHMYSGKFGTNMQERALTPPSLHGYESMLNARETLEAGVTSVRDASGTPVGFRMAIEQGLFAGPRMKLSITALSQTGGTGTRRCPRGSSSGSRATRRRSRAASAMASRRCARSCGRCCAPALTSQDAFDRRRAVTLG